MFQHVCFYDAFGNTQLQLVRRSVFGIQLNNATPGDAVASYA